MSDLVTAVSKLLSDPVELNLFETSPAVSARRLGVSEPEAEAFRALDVQELRWQAECLVDKRRHETRRFLPQTFASLGGRARALFAQYANTYWPEGHQRHQEDARRFAEFLRERKIADRDHAECHRLTFASARFPISLRWLPAYVIRGQHRRALHLLWRWRGQAHQRAFFLAAY